MPRLAQISALALFGLSLCYLADTRADDKTFPTPELSSDAAAPQEQPKAQAEQKPAPPRFVLTLARKGNVNHNPIARRGVPDYADSFDHFQPIPEPAFSSSRPIPKRGSKRTTKPSALQETLRVVCADVKMSASAATGKGVNYTIDCTGPLYVDNDNTTIRCSKLHYADGVLTLDDVTIHQTGSDAGLLEEVQAKQLTIKFPLESLTVQDVDRYVPPEPRHDADDNFNAEAYYEEPAG